MHDCSPPNQNRYFWTNSLPPSQSTRHAAVMKAPMFLVLTVLLAYGRCCFWDNMLEKDKGSLLTVKRWAGNGLARPLSASLRWKSPPTLLVSILTAQIFTLVWLNLKFAWKICTALGGMYCLSLWVWLMRALKRVKRVWITGGAFLFGKTPANFHHPKHFTLWFHAEIFKLTEPRIFMGFLPCPRAMAASFCLFLWVRSMIGCFKEGEKNLIWGEFCCLEVGIKKDSFLLRPLKHW